MHGPYKPYKLSHAELERGNYMHGPYKPYKLSHVG